MVLDDLARVEPLIGESCTQAGCQPDRSSRSVDDLVAIGVADDAQRPVVASVDDRSRRCVARRSRLRSGASVWSWCFVVWSPRSAADRARRELVDAGVRVFEVTFDAPSAAADLARLPGGGRGGQRGDVLVGAGTVRSTDALDAAIGAGADFGVSPLFDPAVLSAALARGLPFVPGALTPTEIDAAWRAGATFVKLFPASSVGPTHVRELHGPMTEVELIPTGGVDGTTAVVFLAAGAVAVGIGGGAVAVQIGRGIVDAVRGTPAGRSWPAVRSGGMNRLSGLVILVTGSTGIAAVSAERFVEEGAAVFVTSRDEGHCRELAERIRATGERLSTARPTWSSAINEAAVEACRPRLRADRRLVLGRRRQRPAVRRRPDPRGEQRGMEATLSLNLRTQALVCTSVVRRMRAQEPNDSGTRGSILLMGSVTATDPGPRVLRDPRLRRGEGRVASLTTAMAATYITDRIRVNAVAPSLTATPMAAARRATSRFSRSPRESSRLPARCSTRTRSRTPRSTSSRMSRRPSPASC